MTRQLVRSRKRNCAIEGCDSHLGRRKRGPHARCIQLDLGDPGSLIIAKLWDDGSRGVERWTFMGGRWTTVESVMVLPEPKLALS